MKYLTLGGATLAAMLANGATGWALTAQETLDFMRQAAGEFGLSVEDDGQSMSGDVLSVSGLRYVAELGSVTVTALAGDLQLAEQGDGTVAIGWPEASSIEVAGVIDEAEIDIRLTASHPDYVVTAKEAEGGIDFDFGEADLAMTLERARLEGKDLDARLGYVFEGLAGISRYRPGQSPTLTGNSTMARLSGSYFYELPDFGMSESSEIEIAGLASQWSATLGDIRSLLAGMSPDTEPGPAMDLIGQVLASGFSMAASSSQDSYRAVNSSVQSGTQIDSAAILGEGRSEMHVDAAGMSMSGVYGESDISFMMQGEFPMPPIALSFDGAEAAVSFPFSEGESDIGMKFALTGLVLEETLWSMIDPAGVLPRDPATLVLDFDGRATWLHDLFSAATVTAMAPPIQLNALDLNALQLSLAGAELTGEGAFTFDNSDLQSFNGMPRPEGTANLRLVGGNGLLERLAEMGLVPQDKVMMVRMMTGMLARPGPGADELLSEIVVDEEGKVLINGAPMPF